MTASYATDFSPIVVDVETTSLDNAADYLEPIPDAVLDDSPIEASKRLVDPVKIAADLDQKREAQAFRNAAAIAKVAQQRVAREEKLALDWNVGRIVCLGWWTEANGLRASVTPTDEIEAVMLQAFWALAQHRTIVGFNIKCFDLRYMVQRSRYLGISYPVLDLGKYSKQGIRDLYLDLTFGDGTYDQGAMRRTLKMFCKRFGLPVTDDIDGKDVPALAAAGDWEAIAKHCTSDLELTLALARKLGVIVAQPEVVGVL